MRTTKIKMKIRNKKKRKKGNDMNAINNRNLKYKKPQEDCTIFFEKVILFYFLYDKHSFRNRTQKNCSTFFSFFFFF